MKNIFIKLKDNLVHISALLLLGSLFFPFRKTFITTQSYVLGEFSDFTTISLYLSDILLLVLFLVLIFKYKAKIHPSKLIACIILYIILAFFASLSLNLVFLAYFSLKLIELIVLHETVKTYFSLYPQKIVTFFKVFVGLAIIPSVIAFGQFLAQKSLGISHWLGEPNLSSLGYGIAKIIDSSGLVFLRPYGLFPHPNILSAFILTAVLFQTWLILKKNWLFHPIISYLIQAFLLLSLFLTFSRSGMMALCLSLLCLFIISHLGKDKIVKPLAFCALTIIVSMILLWPFYEKRGEFNNESVTSRLTYNQTALNIIRGKPIFGLGPGQSVLHMQQYSPKNLESWEIQPIHNYFLLSATEIGLPGAMLLLILILSYLFKLFKQKDSRASTLLGILLIGYLILMQFDHYFWTTQQTQFLLWIILGLCSALISSKGKIAPHETYEQTNTSQN